jgi:hypothetical protein
VESDTLAAVHFGTLENVKCKDVRKKTRFRCSDSPMHSSRSRIIRHGIFLLEEIKTVVC